MQRKNGNNKELSFPDLPVRRGLGTLPLSKLLLKEEKQPYLVKQVEDPRQKPSGMTPDFTGFTLIELLVVVLIIGILAAVALPQYQKAVEKSRATQAITLLKSVYTAAKAYQLANGEWPTTFDELAVEIPWTGTRNGISIGHYKRGKSNADWSIQILNSRITEGCSVVVTRISGPYSGASFEIYAVPGHPQYKEDEMVCVEMVGGSAAYKFTKSKGAYCKKIMKGTLLHTTSEGSWNYFRMP